MEHKNFPVTPRIMKEYWSQVIGIYGHLTIRTFNYYHSKLILIYYVETTFNKSNLLDLGGQITLTYY